MKNTFFITLLLSVFCFISQAKAQSTDTLKSMTLKIGNLTCDGDMPTIQKNLLNQDGIDEVMFTSRKKEASTFTVLFHSAATDADNIKLAVENTPGCDDPDEKPYRVQHISTPKATKP